MRECDHVASDNVTGFTSYNGATSSKWLEVLKETAPNLTRVMAILHPETPIHQAFWRSIEDAAPRFGVEVMPGGVHNVEEIERRISDFAIQENSGLILLPHALTGANCDFIISAPVFAMQRPHLAGRTRRRSARPGTYQVQTCTQSQDC